MKYVWWKISLSNCPSIVSVFPCIIIIFIIHFIIQRDCAFDGNILRTDKYLCNVYIHKHFHLFIIQSSSLNSKITQLNTNNIQHLLYKFKEDQMCFVT